VINAVLFDFGGVILSSPFEAFNVYEASVGLPLDTIRTLNATNPDDNAWAKLERSDVDAGEFAALFEAEARTAGFELDGAAILPLVSGEIRPVMVEALRRIGEAGFATACLTNNFRSHDDRGSGVDSADPQRAAALREVMAMFDLVVESSRVGIRKPEVGFYQIALDELGIEAPHAVFLDDLGVNLKPARAMGMQTIKVISPDQALGELESLIGLTLR
jgi:putative hydrolase of the HAD superfamily